MDSDDVIIVFVVLVLLPAAAWSLYLRFARSSSAQMERQRQADEAEQDRRLVEEHKEAEARLIQVLEARLVQILSSADNDKVIPR